MKHNLNIFALCLSLLAALAVHAQDEGTVAGTVVDRQTGDPLVGATIFLEGTNLGTICDFEGNFRLLNVPSGNYVFVSSMIGYQKTSIIGVQVTAGETQRIEIAIASEAIELDDEVVV